MATQIFCEEDCYSSIVKNPCTTVCTRNNPGDITYGNTNFDSPNITTGRKTLEITSTYILPSVSFQASYTPSEICPRPIESFLEISSPDTHRETVSSQSKVSKRNKDPSDFSDFKIVTNKKKLKKDSQVNNDNKTTCKISEYYKTSADTDLLPMAVVPPMENRLLQSRESDADAKMSYSSLSEEDTLEYIEYSYAVIDLFKL
ncbi:hypothetical protein AVEN_130328-1 [Araneus ventricosus]|uniref:Uncharacterized protein n=1 Tax=Araneus ventricosus TaxID=182803 RepID=A0A4Y2BDZ9_ARAVE|nr:hypothetical protein AVEN_130328-1 [Araneus ventricosus]